MKVEFLAFPKALTGNVAVFVAADKQLLATAQSIDARVTHAIDLRYFHDLDPTCRLTWTNRGRVAVFNIVSVLNVDSRNTLSRVLAIEQVGAAP